MSTEILFDLNDVSSSRRYIHNPSDFARKKLIYVQEVGCLRSLKPHTSSRSNLESYLLFVVTDGRGRVKVGDKNYQVSSGDVVFIDCRETYEHESSESEPWELKWVHMNGGIVPEYYEIFMSKNNGCPVYKVTGQECFSGTIDKVIELQAHNDVTNEYMCNHLLTGMVTEFVVELINEDNKKLNPDVLNSIRGEVNERFKEDNLFESMCIAYGMDEIAINSQFKEKYGIDLCDYILNRRFTCAKELLRFTIKPVKDIVEESGIKNADLFRHLFIENEGMTAEEYRRRWSQWNRG